MEVEDSAEKSVGEILNVFNQLEELIKEMKASRIAKFLSQVPQQSPHISDLNKLMYLLKNTDTNNSQRAAELWGTGLESDSDPEKSARHQGENGVFSRESRDAASSYRSRRSARSSEPRDTRELAARELTEPSVSRAASASHSYFLHFHMGFICITPSTRGDTALP